MPYRVYNEITIKERETPERKEIKKMKMETLTANEVRAYEIGINEAHEQKRIVPACKSQKMNELMNEVKNGLLPLIKAYDKGVAFEINRQTKLGF